MKKTLSLIVLVLVFALALSACGCKHETWNDANCETPKTCADCGETEGAALGHTWMAATCETPKTCETCGKTEGEAKGHDWVEANCENAKTCSACKLTEGEALGHVWQDATTEAPKTCETCALTEGERIVTDPRFTTAATADIQGKWGYTINATGDMMGEPGFNGSLKFMLVLELGNDGTMSMYLKIVDVSDMKSYLTDAMYAELAKEGLSREQADAAIKEATGMTMEQYIEYVLGTIDFNSMLGSVNFNGVYYVEDGKLYSGMTWNSQMTPDEFTLEGDTLNLAADIAGTGESFTPFQRITDEE